MTVDADLPDRSNRELVFTRLINAPREQVFAAWLDPEKLKLWWGPKDFHAATHAMEARPGGQWRFTLQGPGGTETADRVTYTEIAPPERLCYQHAADPSQPHSAFQAEMSLSEEGSATCLTLRLLFDTAEQCATLSEHGAVACVNETLDRLQGLFFTG